MAKAKINKVIKGLQKASKTHAKQAKTLQSIKMKDGGTVKDACYKKVKAASKVWPSAYASGRLVQCREVGAANYGNKSRTKKAAGGVVCKGQTMLMPGKRKRTKLA